MRVIVHGGAGSRPGDYSTDEFGSNGSETDVNSHIDKSEDRQTVLDEAAKAGADMETVTDAVCTAITVLELAPQFNAGVGSTVQSDQVVRTDAGLMTDDREVGAACGMPGVKRAIEVARIVKEETPHVLIAGVHAVDLAASFGVETGVNLWTDSTHDQWDQLENVPSTTSIRQQLDWIGDRFGGFDGVRASSKVGGTRERPREGSANLTRTGDVTETHDTVGAVARSGDRIAAGASTGGRWLALAGRVGDVPQVGSGFYCSRAGGASVTGDGEDIARVTLARRAVDHLENGREAQAAAKLAVAELEDITGGSGGVIVARNDGDVGWDYNTEEMQTSVADAV